MTTPTRLSLLASINTRLSKVLMDEGSSLNIIYLKTLDLLGIERA